MQQKTVLIHIEVGDYVVPVSRKVEEEGVSFAATAERIVAQISVEEIAASVADQHVAARSTIEEVDSSLAVYGVIAVAAKKHVIV